jgi:hypothetical protein
MPSSRVTATGLLALGVAGCAPAATPPPTSAGAGELEESAEEAEAFRTPAFLAAPRVHLGEVLLGGASAPDELRHALERQVDGFKECYLAGLERDASIAGTMTLTFKVDQGGLIPKRGIGNWGDVVGDVELQRCVMDHTLAGSYPGSEAGEAEVSFELRFTR